MLVFATAIVGVLLFLHSALITFFFALGSNRPAGILAHAVMQVEGSAHGRAHDEAQVIDLQALGDQQPLAFHHVGVAVLREFRVQPVAGLRRLAVTDAVGQHDEILRRV